MLFLYKESQTKQCDILQYIPYKVTQNALGIVLCTRVHLSRVLWCNI